MENLEALRIVTRCTSRDQFIAMFRRFCSPTSCFIPSPDSRPLGTAVAFSIRLADGTQLLRGQGVVLDAWTTADNRFKRPGVHLGIHRLFDDSAELYAQLLVVDRSVAVRMPVAAQLRLIHETVPNVAAHLETPTIEMPPLPLPEEPRVPGADFILPANPLTDLTDDLVAAFVECNLTNDDSVDVAPLSAETFDSVTETTSAPPLHRPVIVESFATDVPPPANSPVLITDAVPIDTPFDPTTPNPTIVYPRAARDTIPSSSPGSRDIIATLLGVAPLGKPQVYAAPTPVVTELMDRVQTPIEVPVIVSLERISPLRRMLRAFAARLRRWWVPATVAATLMVVAVWFTA